MVFENESDYEKISEYDEIKISNMKNSIETGKFILEDITKGIKIKLRGDFSEREKEILLEGGYLNYAKNLDLEGK